MRYVIKVCCSLAAVTLGCASGGASSGGTDGGVVTTPRLQGVLQARGSAISGEMSVSPTSREGEFRAALTLRGSNAGEQHPWHVHTGRCDAEGPIVGSMLAYPVLQIRGDGNADLAQTIRERLVPGTSYYVDIHRSRANMDIIIACADLHPAG